MKICLALILLGVTATVSAQTVWRCGSSYSTTPCADTVAGRPVNVADPADPDRAREANQVAQRERQTVQALVAERHQRADEARRNNGSGLSGIQPLPKAPALKRARSQPDFKLRTHNPRPLKRRRAAAG